ncbi:MAG TPA: WYL domain-containing protein, partial [Mycobacteriales bacterium]|nr:WYL domain-containing protein [Mycobacteriales bacterium]
LWQSAELADAARGALLKLRAGGVDVDATRGLDLEPRVDAAEEALHPCLDAVQTGRAVAFGYRKPGGESESREVEPWGVVSWRGRWYLVGHDRGRDATRCFRLSRVSGAVRPVGPEGAVKVPTGIDLVAHVAATEPPEYTRVAAVRVRRGTGTWLRRIASSVQPGGPDEEWDTVRIGYDDPEWVGDRIARQGANAVVDSPPEVRDAVVRRLGAQGGVPAPAGEGVA